LTLRKHAANGAVHACDQRLHADHGHRVRLSECTRSGCDVSWVASVARTCGSCPLWLWVARRKLFGESQIERVHSTGGMLS
jgi:hypothetical protein